MSLKTTTKRSLSFEYEGEVDDRSIKVRKMVESARDYFVSKFNKLYETPESDSDDSVSGSEDGEEDEEGRGCFDTPMPPERISCRCACRNCHQVCRKLCIYKHCERVPATRCKCSSGLLIKRAERCNSCLLKHEDGELGKWLKELKLDLEKQKMINEEEQGYEGGMEEEEEG
jgi:hypothetical protein